MSRKLHRVVNRWLEAERGGDTSERTLRRVFQTLPAPRLPAGFAERVLLGVGLAVPRPVAMPLVWRVAIVMALAIAAAATATVPGVALGLLRRINPGDVLQLAATMVVETCQRLAEGLAVWQTINSIGETFASALSSPAILAALMAATLLSAGGLRMLHGLLATDRRHENAQA